MHQGFTTPSTTCGTNPGSKSCGPGGPYYLRAANDYTTNLKNTNRDIHKPIPSQSGHNTEQHPKIRKKPLRLTEKSQLTSPPTTTTKYCVDPGWAQHSKRPRTAEQIRGGAGLLLAKGRGEDEAQSEKATYGVSKVEEIDKDGRRIAHRETYDSRNERCDTASSASGHNEQSLGHVREDMSRAKLYIQKNAIQREQEKLDKFLRAKEIVDLGQQTAPSPICSRIRAERAKGMVPNMIPINNGTTCSYEHQIIYETTIEHAGHSKNLMVNLFYGTLWGEAIAWFMNLDLKSIRIAQTIDVGVHQQF